MNMFIAVFYLVLKDPDESVVDGFMEDFDISGDGEISEAEFVEVGMCGWFTPL